MVRMTRPLVSAVLLLTLCPLALGTAAPAQTRPAAEAHAAAPADSSPWQLQPSGTTTGLRGIHAVSSQIAWASGTGGTILRTTDGGRHWQRCATPPEAAQLDFRGIWAWSATTAMAMSSGPGALSRLYKTTDGCASWELLETNSSKQGFWDAMVFQTGNFGFAIGGARTGIMIGDPVHGRFETQVMFLGHGWFTDDAACTATPGEAAFAASNSSVVVFGNRRYILGTGGKGGPHALISPLLLGQPPTNPCLAVPVPIAGGTPSSGVFSLAFRDLHHGVAVGGDYTQPNNPHGTAAWSSDGGRHWHAASHPPHGYRSAVAWDPAAHAWIAAGTNGSDISYDGGRTWQPFGNGNWNALSLPWIVGPNGRIARLDPGRLPSPPQPRPNPPAAHPKP
jgi:photosystem II stability/assembly factor-like uncharacterized protein